jgi:hypothetical protein
VVAARFDGLRVGQAHERLALLHAADAREKIHRFGRCNQCFGPALSSEEHHREYAERVCPHRRHGPDQFDGRARFPLGPVEVSARQVHVRRARYERPPRSDRFLVRQRVLFAFEALAHPLAGRLQRLDGHGLAGPAVAPEK